MNNDFQWANQKPSDKQLEEWVEAFHRDGYLVIENVLPPDWISELKQDLDRALEGSNQANDIIEINVRMFETSKANLRLFDLEPIVSFAEALIVGPCHVVHNNSFRVRPGKGITTWHQDDSSHYLVTHGEPPTNVRLPVMLFTANYYLTDVPEQKYGPTEVIPRSHLFGAAPPPVMEGTKYEDLVVPCVGNAGSVVLFNNQVWHRGGPNQTERVRYMTQVSYARYYVGHKYYPFMNYVMPEHVYADADPRLRRLLGFLPRGPYA